MKIIILLILILIVLFNIVSKFGDFKKYDSDTKNYNQYSEMIGGSNINPIFSTNKFPNLIIEYTTPDNISTRNMYPILSILNKNNNEIVNTNLLISSPQTYFKQISGSGDPTKKGSKVKYIFMGLNEIINEEMEFDQEYSIGIKLDTNSPYVYTKFTFTTYPYPGNLIIDEADFTATVYTE